MPQTDSNLKLIIYSIKLYGEQEQNIQNVNSENEAITKNEAITRFNEKHGRNLYICHEDDDHRIGELRVYEKENKKVKKKERKGVFYVGERDSS